jgi:repressor LexA
MKSIINDRIRQRRIAMNLTLLELANRLGVREATVQRYESGAIKNIKYETVMKMAASLDCAPEYLMGWASDPEGKNFVSIDEEKAIRIPVYGSIAAGIPLEANEDIEEYVNIYYPNAKREEYIALRIKGDSMEPRMCDGDIVIIHLQSTVEDGQIAAVRINDPRTDCCDATCKKIKHTCDGGVMLVSNNPSYEPMYFSKKDMQDKGLEVIGRVVESRARY